VYNITLMSNTAPKVGFVSLGCPKALVDSERILTQLRAEGYEISNNYQDAGVVVVNTCGFIESAVEESFDAIGEAMAENGKVIVTGCLGIKKDLILEKYPNVLSITPAHAYEAVISAVHEHLPPTRDPFVSLVPPQGIKLTPRHYAYLKISEGCNHKCTFCIIPSMRGKLQSRLANEVMIEASKLAKAGVKELLIISQDTSAYGVDKKYQETTWQNQPLKTKFSDLVEALGELGIWVRLHYVYPYPHVDEIIPLMAAGKILPYLDIPFQHANARILKLMKRPASSENNLTRIKAWREICPDMTIRSTFIVGFPSETEEEFEELLDFLREAKLDRVGAFAYSPVEGAAANTIENPVPEEIKQDRLKRFMEVQAAISREKLQQKIGQTLQVIIDRKEGERYIGRTMGDAPEIDGLVFIESKKPLKLGEFYSVAIKNADEHDLYGMVS
jgi:ribosomal protein S12 methylthiotransferase